MSEFLMTNSERNPKCKTRTGCSLLVILSSFVIRHSSLAIGLLLMTPVAVCHAQRAFSISIRTTNSVGPTISWKAQSATPVGDLFIVPQFVLQRSSDLKTWIPITTNIMASLGQTISVTDTNPGRAFYRVGSIIQKEYAQMSNVQLGSGQLAGADFFGATLFGTSFNQAQLPGASLSGADVTLADFTLADLSGADLFNLQASQAVFDGAVLNGADASFADFEFGSFFSTDLRGVDFTFSILSSANLDFAALYGSRMDTNTVIDPVPKLIWQIVNLGLSNLVLTNAVFTNATLTNLNFKGVDLTRANLFGDDLTGSDLRGANFTSATNDFVDFTGTLIDGSTVLDAKSRLVWGILNQPLAGRDLHGTNISSTFLFQANLSAYNLTNSVCTNAFWEDCNLGGANLSRGNFTDTVFLGSFITNANLTQANFQRADFTDASLRNSITNGANFAGAKFSNTIMPDGSIRNF
jgi:uncharacterized protein YjbI with pentapeptide repeats